jgi:hypothetical protein
MTFRHYLNFIDLPSVGTIEISEPIGWDGASYKVKKEGRRFGRDIIIANEDTELTFTRSFFEELEVIQTTSDGKTINYASQGFDYLLDVFQNEGWESQIEYIIEKDDLQFVTGIFSYSTAVVEFDQITVKIIQNTNREIIKRLEDTDIDAFSSEALDGRTITPCETTNILLKAKPIVQSSEWKQPEISNQNFGKTSTPDFPPNTFWVFNYLNQVENYGIENTLSFIQDKGRITASTDLIGNFAYIFALNDFDKGTIIFDNINLSFIPNLYVQSYNVKSYYVISKDGNFDYNDKILLLNQTNPTSININQTLTGLNIRRNNKFYFWFEMTVNETLAPLLDANVVVSFNSGNIKAEFTSTAIDTVVKGIRLIDLMKHNVKSLADAEVNAPIYDIGGEHYNNFTFNGLLLGQITDKPFYNKFKDLMDIPDEVCADYQINPDNVEIRPYADHYTDEEMAVFEQLPKYDAMTKPNKNFALKTADFKYKSSSSGRETNGENSIDDVHTETQKYITDTVDGNLKVELNHIRSAYLIEEARQRAFDNEQSKSLENDDKLFLLDVTELAPSTKGGFGANLLMQINESGHLQILNNNLEGDGINFNWGLLGFAVGGTFFIDEGENVGTWQVLTITSSVLTLFPISVTASYEGEAFIKVSYFFNDVLYTNRTNEGFTLIDGVIEPSKYSNLNYSWSRNIKRWYPYLATATKFKPNGVIKTASFKTNGNLVTQKIGESTSLADSADIINSEIASQKILNPFVHSITVYADFEKVTQLIEDIRDLKGYVTVKLNDGRTVKGYPSEIDYTWVSEELTMDIEEKFISDFMEITDSGITLNGYENQPLANSFQINNIFVLLYNSDDIQLYPPIRFTNIKIEGVQYTDITEFTDALTELI